MAVGPCAMASLHVAGEPCESTVHSSPAAFIPTLMSGKTMSYWAEKMGVWFCCPVNMISFCADVGLRKLTSPKVCV
jgi:hypothetical protein